jgi:hypothetical protein
MSAKFIPKLTNIGLLWPHPEAVEGDDTACLGHSYHDRCNTGKIYNITLDNAQDEAARNSCVNRIAAPFQHKKSRMGRSIMARRSHVATTEDKTTTRLGI